MNGEQIIFMAVVIIGAALGLGLRTIYVKIDDIHNDLKKLKETFIPPEVPDA